jgi:hypothetical protein
MTNLNFLVGLHCWTQSIKLCGNSWCTRLRNQLVGYNCVQNGVMHMHIRTGITALSVTMIGVITSQAIMFCVLCTSVNVDGHGVAYCTRWPLILIKLINWLLQLYLCRRVLLGCVTLFLRTAKPFCLVFVVVVVVAVFFLSLCLVFDN